MNINILRNTVLCLIFNGLFCNPPNELHIPAGLQYLFDDFMYFFRKYSSDS